MNKCSVCNHNDSLTYGADAQTLNLWARKILTGLGISAAYDT